MDYLISDTAMFVILIIIAACIAQPINNKKRKRK